MEMWVCLRSIMAKISMCTESSFLLFSQLAREDYVELRQEATELQEYSNVKLARVMRYLGVLADKSRKLGMQSLYSK